MVSRFALLVCVACTLFGCRSAADEKSIDVTLIVDGVEQTYSFAQDLTVDQVLASAQIELGPRDRTSHPIVSQIEDGMLLTIRRVHEKQVCEQQEIVYQRKLVAKEGVAADEQRFGQSGKAGIQEVCYRVTFEDDVEAERILLGLPTIVREPVDEIVYVGPAEEAEPVSIPGRLSFINHGNAWTIKDNVINKRPLTTGQNLDSLVFHQRDDGARLIFTSETDETDAFFNELWLIATDGDAEPTRMTPSDVLFAEWRPRINNEIAYSTGESRVGTAGWKALNNLWLMSIDLESGRTLSIEEAVPESAGGLYGWWGTHFAWSPYGDKMAWVRADGIGLVDFEQKRLKSLVTYAVFHSSATWVWLSPVSWSHDNQLIASIVHGAPLGDEPSEKSPIFDLAVTSADGRFSAPVRISAGMWAAPSFSPNTAPPGADFSAGYLAWLEAREPFNSMNGAYDLILADRDGSNQRLLFPSPGAAGIRKSDFGLTAKDLAWSPDARFIALIYQGDLWLVEVKTAATYQVTFDGESSNPVWTR